MQTLKVSLNYSKLLEKSLQQVWHMADETDLVQYLMISGQKSKSLDHLQDVRPSRAQLVGQGRPPATGRQCVAATRW